MLLPFSLTREFSTCISRYHVIWDRDAEASAPGVCAEGQLSMDARHNRTALAMLSSTGATRWRRDGWPSAWNRRIAEQAMQNNESVSCSAGPPAVMWMRREPVAGRACSGLFLKDEEELSDWQSKGDHWSRLVKKGFLAVMETGWPGTGRCCPAARPGWLDSGSGLIWRLAAG